MNAALILAALVLGFIGGVAGALVTIEIKTDRIRKEIDDSILGISHVNSQVKTLKETDNALMVAIQELTIRQKRDRGAIWESLNGLWADYDQRHKKQQKAEPKQEPEKPAKKERKKTKNEEPGGAA
jgi:hypothetical protein